MGPSKLFMLSILMLLTHNLSSKRIINVDDHSAVGDGATDDSKAFKRAWKKACTSSDSAVFVVPKHKKYMLKQLNFTGPCKSHVTFMIKGTIEASLNRSDWNDENRRLWIVFDSVQNLKVKGGGVINGNGHVWWQNSCKINKTLPCIGAPTALVFVSCKHLRLRNLRIKDSQQFHISVKDSKEVKISKLSIHAPEKSPNTDGIHLDHARNVLIRDCEIRTGDDCISIWAGSKNVKVHKIVCGPGHGISIGSLGKNNTEDHVKNVMVDTVTLNGTTNGVRIKTWQGGRGYAKHITFKNIDMRYVKNPILIDQFYCDSKTPCHEQHDAVEVKHVLYKNIKGTSASNVSVKFNCSKTIPCRGIKLENIELVGEDGESTQSYCNNVHWTRKGTVVPHPCVSKSFIDK